MNATIVGRHLILELNGVEPSVLRNEYAIEEVLISAAKKAGATVLASKFHHFGGDYGVTGVIVLSESHISIHTWPEFNYAAIDVFMCGTCNPNDSLPTILEYFEPESWNSNIYDRGPIT